MKRAAHGLAGAAAGMLKDRRVGVDGSRIVVLAGSGNNAGDALYAAAELAVRGARATAMLTAGRTHGPALAAFERAGGRTLLLPQDSSLDGFLLESGFLADVTKAHILIDGILGTGATGGLREPAASLVRVLQTVSGPAVVACDLPSGINADTGEVTHPVLGADHTVTFGATKVGLLASPAEGFAGKVQLIDIGLAPQLAARGVGGAALRRLETEDLAALLPEPVGSDQKYTRGVLGIVAGSAQYPGAAQLSCAGALACGVGMVRYLGPEAVATLIHGQSPEAVCSQGDVGSNRVQAWLVGPGITGDAAQEQRSRDALDSGLPVVADAGALEFLPDSVARHVVLTPHAGELATLLSARGHNVQRGDVEANGLRYVRLAADLTGATVLLKGSTTVVASPGSAYFSQSEGTAWMATAGSGDTLAGILGALLAALADDVDRFERLGIAAQDRWAATAALAASLHGRAGAAASAGGPLKASDISAAIPDVWRRLIPHE
ncbi:NAD(P)H-hydrate epimerase [Paenarthrobacter sp. Z7-10]|uniref:NAD(P)H-hydrate epimerase n=1 Tax=Paenarthrobacter sp. Z7-10 TaxID=2787635 RepID=UPI002E7808AE|nr:NAD(P)H-hydrate epimerase [Paenarthrobacter sp. Z7-10]